MQETGLKISTMRKSRNMTQVELADKIGVTYQAVSSWERGLTMPDISKLPDVSQVLEISIDELLGNTQQATIIKTVLRGEPPAEVTVENLADVSPILKPKQVDELAQVLKTFAFRDLTDLAPFIDSTILEQLSEKAFNNDTFEDLEDLAPFLTESYIRNFVRRFTVILAMDIL